MGWLKRQMRKLVLRAAKYAGIPLRDPALVQMLGSQPVTAGVDVDEQSALGLSAYWQGVNIISQNIAAMPIILCEMKEGGATPATDVPEHDLLLISPNEEMTPFTFRETIQAHALTWGNGYAHIDREADSPDAPINGLTLLQPDQMTPDRDQETGDSVYRFTAKYEGEEDAIYEPWEVLHFPGLGFDGRRGYSVVQMARESIGLGLAEEKFGAAFFGRGCTIDGILEIPDELEMSEKARKNLRESFELLHRGPDNAHRIAVLEQGVTYRMIGIPPGDSQYLQSRQFQIAEVARWLNLPPHLLRDLSNATFSNIEHQGIDFLVYTLRPWMLKWEQECRRKLVRRKDRRRYCFQHDVHNLLMTDITARYNAYNTGRSAGFLTLNDILRREKLPLLPNTLGNSRLIPLNMRAVDEQGQDVLVGSAGEKDRASAQAKSILDILVQVANNTIPVESATYLITVAAPDVSREQVQGILKPFIDRFPAEGATNAA